MLKRDPKGLDKVLTLTPSLRRQAVEFLLSRGFLSYGKEDHKVRAVAILLREGGEFDVTRLAGMHPTPAQTVVKSLEVLVSAGAVTLIAHGKFRLNVAAPLAAGYYASKTARFFRVAALDARKAVASRQEATKFRVLRAWNDLGDRPSLTFVDANLDAPDASAREAVLAAEAFRTFAKLRREVTP